MNKNVLWFVKYHFGRRKLMNLFFLFQLSNVKNDIYSFYKYFLKKGYLNLPEQVFVCNSLPKNKFFKPILIILSVSR